MWRWGKNKLVVILVLAFWMPSAAQQSKSQKVKCKQIEKTLEGSDDPIILRKCTYQNYIFKSKGRADQKGRYSYEYSVFETREKDTIEISNSRFFKNVDNLESILNDRLSKMYQSDQKIRELAMCMEWKKLDHYSINDFDISISEDETMTFYLDHELGSACFNVSVDMIKFKLEELTEYLIE